MSVRRLLLIDPDENFFRILHAQVTPYGFEIYRVDPTPDALGYVDELSPELVFIAVEEPDKLGYSLCNKAKKGVARDIPVVLTTSTVPPSGFNSHRKLRVHADEYIDKRSMAPDELLNKISEQIGLGEPAVAVALEAEDESEVFDGMEDFDMDLDDAFSEDGERTRIAPPGMAMDFGFDEDAEAMAASLAGDDDPLFDEEDDLPEAAIPSFFREEQAERPYDRSATVQADAPDSMVAPPPAAPPMLHEPSSTHSSGPISRPSNPNLDVISSREPPPLDVGLDQSFGPSASEHGQLEQRLQALEEENRRLQGELERASAGAGAGAGGGSSLSRERELLNLRETINKKERELLDLRDEVGGKERAILDGKEKIRQLEHTKTALDAKNLELEQRLLQFHEHADTLERERKQAGEHVRSLETALDEARNGLQASQAESARSLAEATAQIDELRQQHARELADAEQRAGQGKDAALGELRAQLDARVAELSDIHQQEVARERGAANEALEDAKNALESAKAEHESALVEARATADKDAAALREQHQQALAELRRELEDKSAAERQALEQQQAQARASLENEQKSALAAQAEDAKTALEAAGQRHAEELQQAAQRAATEREELEATLREQFTAERETLERVHTKALTELESERRGLETDLHAAGERIESLERGLAQAKKDIAERDAAIEERDSSIDEHAQALTERDAHITTLETDIEELDAQTATLQQHVLRAYKKIQVDEATVAKAKKALAIALTLLDDNIVSMEHEASDDA